MRKRFRVLLLAALVAAVVVPVGFALSLDTPRDRSNAGPAPMPMKNDLLSMTIAAPVALTTVVAPKRMPVLPEMPDRAKLFVVGTLLVAGASAVKRAR
jgi:hypothetical protein